MLLLVLSLYTLAQVLINGDQSKVTIVMQKDDDDGDGSNDDVQMAKVVTSA